MRSALKAALLAGVVLATTTPAHAAVKPTCFGKRATIVGTNRADRLRGTARADVIAARGGDDVVVGLGGNDLVCGGDGNDHLDAGAGRDSVDGGAGANWCRGERLRRCDTTPPTVIAATVRDATVELNFSEVLHVHELEPDVFAARLDTPFGPLSERVLDASVDGSNVRLTLAVAVAGDETLGVAHWNFESLPPVIDVAGNRAPDFEIQVENASAPGCAHLPTGRTRYGEGAYDPTFAATAVGTLKAVVLFVDFPDAQSAVTTQNSFDAIFPPAIRYLQDASYGRLELSLAPRFEWLRMPRPSTEYMWGFGDDIVATRADAFLADAVQLADTATDFSGAEAVFVVTPRRVTLGSSWAESRSRGRGLAVDGTQIRHLSALVSDVRIDRVAAHETSHFFSLPDLYDLSSYDDEERSKRLVGDWDPMSALEVGADFLAWHKWKLGWLDPPQVRCVRPAQTLEETLTPLAEPGGLKALVVPTGPRTAYVVENRQPLGRDAGLCDRGALVYSVDADAASGSGPVLVKSAHPGGDTDVALRSRCGPLYNAPLDVGPDEVAVFEDNAAGVRIEVLGKNGLDLRVRVTRR